MKVKVLILVCLFTTVIRAQDTSHGQVNQHGEEWTMWSEAQGKWLPVLDFWLAYAAENGGLTWGRSSQYPAYEQVNEYDTFMVETAHGVCLMEFFHQRWRRANDVRRWDEALNDYGGCPHVFD